MTDDDARELEAKGLKQLASLFSAIVLGVMVLMGVGLALFGQPLLFLGGLGAALGVGVVLAVVSRVVSTPSHGAFQGHPFRVLDRVVEVDMKVSNPATLGRRELEEIANGEASPRTGTFAAKSEFREAVKTLLASGRETVLFLEDGLVRFEGFERGRVERVVAALVKLAGPGFILNRHVGPGVCPYCKESVVAAETRCEKCGAAHHAACFAEHGGCAIFGCERAPLGRRAREKA